MDDRTHDVIVIGTGTAASGIAGGVSKAGRSVVVVDHRPFGGTCVLRGCDPKKVLVAAAEAIDAAERMAGKDVVAGRPRIDWPALQRFKRSFTDPVPERREKSFADRGIEALHGHARFTGRHSVDVEGRTLKAPQIVVAAGAQPVKLPIEGFEHLRTSDDFLDLERLPRRLVLVGGGYIGFEFAHIAARAGAHVTLLNRSDRPLSNFDPDLVRLLVERTRALGVDVRLGHEVKAVRTNGDAFVVEADAGGSPVRFEADFAVHSGGRAPALDALDLDAAGVDCHDGRIVLDEHLRSRSNPAVYAAGDASGGPMPLTPVASLQADAVLAHLLHGRTTSIRYDSIPSVAFSLPPLARVGLQQSEAESQGIAFDVRHEHAPDWFTARRLNESCYGFKVLTEKGSGRILGAHLVGPDAAEVINLFAMAIRHGLTADALRATTFAYPTAASDLDSMLP